MHEHGLAGTVPGRFVELSATAESTFFLPSDVAGYCLGTNLLIDGGYSLR